MKPTPPGRITGSRGREAFSTALTTLASYRPDRAGRPPAYTYLLPPGSERSTAPAPVRDSGMRLSGPLVAAAADLRSGRTSSVELVEQALLAVEKFDGELNAVAHLLADTARRDASARDAEAANGQWRGSLHGIPLTVKDVIDVAGAPTRAGSDAYHDLPTADATAVARARAAGAVILAKVTTHEFALGVTSPQSRNPHDTTRIPGGSSGGSAIAVSTGMGLGSIGTDTRASIRVPAALSGTVGFKPTFGSIPKAGVVPLSWTMDHVAPMASTVADVTLLLDALTAPDQPPMLAWAGAAVAGLRIGVPAATFAGIEPEVEEQVNAALVVLTELGCAVAECARPSAHDLEASNAAGLVISRCEAATFHRALGTDRTLYWDEVSDQLDTAAGVLAMDYIDAQRLRAELATMLYGIFEDFDLLVMPTASVVAPLATDFARHLLLLSRNAIPWSLVGFPAMSMPCGRPGRLPVGLQLVARPWREDLLVALGTAIEQALRTDP